MAPRTDAEWLTHYKAAIRSHTIKDILSQTYELVSAAMFSYAHDVKLCPPSYPGYDFTVSHSGKTMRVPCKKLGLSDGEKSFREQARQLYEHVHDTSVRLGTPSFQMVLELDDPTHKLNLTLSELRSGLTNCLAAFQNGQPTMYYIGGWRLTLAPLYYGPRGLPVDREYASHIFIYIAPSWQDEQRRFSDRFKEAARKLKAHGQPSEDANMNVVMIGLPPVVSLETATEWLRHKFSRDYSSVSGVLLNRPILVSSIDLFSTSLQNEVALVTNPNAKVNWYKFIPPGFTYNLKVPIGGVTETESYSTLSLHTGEIELKDKYVFQRGQVNLEPAPKGKELEISFFEASGVQYNIIERIPGRGAFGISVTTPPDNALLLL
jgi:hypothetical protein